MPTADCGEVDSAIQTPEDRDMSPADTARMTIGGHAVDSPDRFVVIDPATEEPIGFAPDCQPETLAARWRRPSRRFRFGVRTTTRDATRFVHAPRCC